jgi:hypothetical protein
VLLKSGIKPWDSFTMSLESEAEDLVSCGIDSAFKEKLPKN